MRSSTAEGFFVPLLGVPGGSTLVHQSESAPSCTPQDPLQIGSSPMMPRLAQCRSRCSDGQRALGCRSSLWRRTFKQTVKLLQSFELFLEVVIVVIVTSLHTALAM